MKRRALAFASLLAGAPVPRAAGRPNIVFIVSEDNSARYSRLFDPSGAPTPHIEELAKSGLVFDRAFSTSPVCSVARTTLATSIYAPRLATQFHRKAEPANLPSGWKMFPAYLRAAGYYTTNHSKTDYNVVAGDDVWDESSPEATWRKRPHEDRPFFHMETHMLSHESSLHFTPAEMENDHLETDPASVVLPRFLPDTPLSRYTAARYHDRIRAIDERVGETVARLPGR